MFCYKKIERRGKRVSQRINTLFLVTHKTAFHNTTGKELFNLPRKITHNLHHFKEFQLFLI